MPIRIAVRRIPVATAVFAAAALLGLATAYEALAQDSWPPADPGASPPMYLGSPGDANDLPGVPRAVAMDMLPDWPRWFAGASGLVMTRTLDAGTATMEPLLGSQLSTADAEPSWPGGVDFHVGRWFGPRQHHAVEFIYWGVYGMDGTAGIVSMPPGAIDAVPQASDVTIGTESAEAYLTGASAQTVARSDLVNDIEINWVYALWDRPEFLPRDRVVSLMWLAGFRFFQLEDVLTVTTTAADPSLGAAMLNVATNNNLYGAQVGAKFDWHVLPRVRFMAVPKFMIAGNSMTNSTSLSLAGGGVATFANDTPVSAHSTLGVFSWLGSIDTGLAWDVTNRWTLSLGYRVVGVGNLAQADGQWPVLIASPDSISGINAGSSTIIHGGFAGFEGRY